jgi:cytochrome c oxidase subunit 3
VALRAGELLVSLNVKWDTNAYGSAQWLVIGSHATLLLIEWAETLGLMLLFWLAPVERKHFSDAVDAVDYWYFMVATWIPLAVLCYLVPRWI